MKINLILVTILCSINFIGCAQTETKNGANTASNAVNSNAAKSNTGSTSNANTVTNANSATKANSNAARISSGDTSLTPPIYADPTGIPECDEALAFIVPMVGRYDNAMVKSSEAKYSALWMGSYNGYGRIKKQLEKSPDKTPAQIAELAKSCKTEEDALRKLMKKYGES